MGVLEDTELPELLASRINYVAFINQTFNMEPYLPDLSLDLTFQKSGGELAFIYFSALILKEQNKRKKTPLGLRIKLVKLSE